MAIWTLPLLVLGAAAGAILRRADSPTDACSRFSQQTTVVGSTVYIYGGQASTEAGQMAGRWNNNFLTLSLGEDWKTTAPVLKGLPQPDGPPAVANGYLWHDFENIYLYGGLFSDTPPVQPEPFALWRYGIKDGMWTDVTGQTKGPKDIQRVAEGAGATIPGRNLGYYFGGHLDGYTTQGWSNTIPRVYLKSLLEFNMDTMEFRNVTEAGSEGAGFPPRADGVLLFIPWGKEGILVSIGGGTDKTFQQMNIVDIYDLGTKSWTKQATEGEFPKYRVNPCAVVASASDGSSHNIYFWAGQNLIPYGEQIQYNDMWILTIPAFTWIKVDQSGQSVPPARAGHSCELVGTQLVIIGGYSSELSCDSPGFYVFDASDLKWQTTYSATLGGFKHGDSSQDSESANSPAAGVYKVPDPVIAVVGGNRDGGATITKPIRTADPDSPIITGDAREYKYTTYATVHLSTSTAADGSIATATKTSEPSSEKRPNVAAIVGGVVGGIVFIVALLFLGAWILYKRKIRELRTAAASLPGSAPYTDSRQSKEEASGMLGAHQRVGSSEDLAGVEPTFWGVLLSPRRSLRVVNH